jgi:DNA-binding NarL/FixJ family response regulator
VSRGSADGEPSGQIPVLIAEDQSPTRERLKTMLNGSGFSVVSEAANGSQAVSAARSLNPVVAIVDLALPDWGGLDATRRIIAEAPDVNVLIMSAFDSPDVLREVLASGASGYLLKGSSREELTRAVTTVASGELWVTTPRLTELLESEPTPATRRRLAERDVPPVSMPERELIGLVAEGLSSEQMAARLGSSAATVKSSVRRLVMKIASMRGDS